MLLKCLTGVIHTNMMSPEQIKNITHIYSTLMDAEKKGWTNLDDYMELLEFLDDDQLHRECDVLYSIHKTKKMGCPSGHEDGSKCFVVDFLEAIEAITDLYKETGNLHIKNRYLLCNYLTLCQDGQIVELAE